MRHFLIKYKSKSSIHYRSLILRSGKTNLMPHYNLNTKLLYLWLKCVN